MEKQKFVIDPGPKPQPLSHPACSYSLYQLHYCISHWFSIKHIFRIWKPVNVNHQLMKTAIHLIFPFWSYVKYFKFLIWVAIVMNTDVDWKSGCSLTNFDYMFHIMYTYSIPFNSQARIFTILHSFLNCFFIGMCSKLAPNQKSYECNWCKMIPIDGSSSSDCRDYILWK
jgi:hypothetical protein